MEQRVSPRLAIEEWLRAANNLKGRRTSNENSYQYSPNSNRVDNGNTWLIGKQGFHATFQRLDSGDCEDAKRKSYDAAIKRRRGDSGSPLMDNPTLIRPVKMSRRKYCQKTNRISKCHTPRLSSISTDSEPVNSESRATSSTDKSLSQYRHTRRPRRKTRHDKYELKQPKVKSRGKARQKRVSRVKGARGCKRSEKTGATLLHHFSAGNVATERLTLRHKNLGIFKRGRASIPQIREGLPDLAFSEIKFLRPKHNRDSSGKKTGNKNGTNRAKKQVVEKEEDISRFFEGDRRKTRSGSPYSKGRDHNTTTSTTPQKSTKECCHDILDPLSSIVAIEGLGRPFLGFGDRGPQHETGLGAKGAVRGQSSRSASPSRRSRTSRTRDPKGKIPLSGMHRSQEDRQRKVAAAATDKSLQGVAESPTKDSDADMLVKGHKTQQGKSNSSKQIEREKGLTGTKSTQEDLKKAPDKAGRSIKPLRGTLEKITAGAVAHDVLENILKNQKNGSSRHELSQFAESLQRLPVEGRVRMQADVLSPLAKWDNQGRPGQWHSLPNNHLVSIPQGSEEIQKQNYGARFYQHNNESRTVEQLDMCCDKDQPPALIHSPTPQEQIKKGGNDNDKVRASSNHNDHSEVPSNDRGTHFSSGNSFRDQHKTGHLLMRRYSNRLSIRASVWDSPVGLYEQQLTSVSAPSTRDWSSRSRGTTAATCKSSFTLPTHVYGVSLVDVHKNLGSCGRDPLNSQIFTAGVHTQPKSETQGYHALESDKLYKEYSPAVMFGQSADGSEVNYTSRLKSPTGQVGSHEFGEILEQYPPEPSPHMFHENSEWNSDISPASLSCPTNENSMIDLEMGGFWKPHFRY